MRLSKEGLTCLSQLFFCVEITIKGIIQQEQGLLHTRTYFEKKISFYLVFIFLTVQAIVYQNTTSEREEKKYDHIPQKHKDGVTKSMSKNLFL